MPTPYVKQTWIDGVAGATPISAARLAYIEDGIENATMEDGTYAKPATSGTLAARPAASVVGQRYLATDTNGGTQYESLDGATWTQMASGVNPSVTSASNIALRARTELYYVDPTMTDDTGDGRSPGSARKNIPIGSNRIIRILKGNVQLTGALTANNLTDCVIEGEGPNQTSVIVNGDYDAFTLTGTPTRVRLRRLWIGSFASRTAGYGFKATGTSGTHGTDIVLEDVLFQNLPQAVQFQYIDMVKMTNVNYEQSIAGAAKSVLVRLIEVKDCAVRGHRAISTTGGGLGSIAGARMFLIDGGCDTIVLDHVNIQHGAGYGVQCANLVGAATGPRLVKMSKVYVELCSSDGFRWDDGRDVEAMSCHSVANGASGLVMAGGTSLSWLGGFIWQNGRHGVSITGSTCPGLMGAKITNNSQEATTTYDGINVAATVRRARIIGNKSGDFMTTSGNRQRYGLTLATDTNYIAVQGNDLTENGTGSLNNASSGANNQISGNMT